MKLIRAMLFDAFVAACFYGWRVEQIDGASVFLECWLGFVCTCQWIFVLLAKKDDLYGRSKVYVVYDILSTMAIAGALVYVGWTTLAIVLFIGWIFTCAKLDGHRRKVA